MTDRSRSKNVSDGNGTLCHGFVSTFYSFGNGVERSKALTNVGVALALEGKKVLLLDWDFEVGRVGSVVGTAATARHVGSGTRAPGLIDLIEAHAGANDSSLHWKECLRHVEFNGGSLDVISAGSREAGCGERARRLNWESLYEQHRIGNYFDALRTEWRDAYDHVLVDSCPGINDVSDVCTVLLPDVLVLMVSDGDQDIASTSRMLERACKAHAELPVDRSKLIAVPVPLLGPDDDAAMSSPAWLGKFAETFRVACEDWLPASVTPFQALSQLCIPCSLERHPDDVATPLQVRRDCSGGDAAGAANARLSAFIESRFDWNALGESVTCHTANQEGSAPCARG